MIADGFRGSCTSARASRINPSDSERSEPALRAMVEWTQLKKAQCTTNSGGPMASGACVDSAQKPSESRRMPTTKGCAAATEAAGAALWTASRVPSDALRLDDERRRQQS